MYHQIIDEGEESTKAQAEQHLFVADITNNIKNTPVSATAATPHIHDTDDDGANISSSCLDFPPTVLTILIMETAERFAYYGFRAVLVLYFTDALGFSDGVAISLFAFTTSFATLMPVFGAIISDGYLGKYRTIVIFGCVYIVGISVLTAAAYVEDVVSTFIGLSLICIGTGGIKPCVSPFGADQLIDDSDSSSSSSNTWSDDCEGDVDANATSANDKLVQKYFTWFYFCINLGSLASFLLIPSVRAWLGFGYAFLIPAIFIVVSMLVFVSKKSEYRIVTPNDDECSTSSTSLMNVFRIYMHMLKQSRSGCCSCCFSSDNDYGGEMIEDSVSYSSLSGISQQEIEDAKKMARVLPVLATFPVFWMLYDQTGSVWTLQADEMNLHGIEPEQLGVLNPLLVMIFIPLFDRYIYPWCERRGWSIAHLRRISCGMVIIALSFFISGVLETAVEKGSKEADDAEDAGETDTDSYRVDLWWQIPQIVIITVAEILVSVTGLEFAFAKAPASMKSVVMAAFLLTGCIGDLSAGLLYASLSWLGRDKVLHVCGVLMLLNWMLFLRVEKWWKDIDHAASDEVAITEDRSRSTEEEEEPEAVSLLT